MTSGSSETVPGGQADGPKGTAVSVPVVMPTAPSAREVLRSRSVKGLLALVARDRLEAAQRFEAALEIDPSNERAARELADMRRQATNERKGLLSRLMGKKDPGT